MGVVFVWLSMLIFISCSGFIGSVVVVMKWYGVLLIGNEFSLVLVGIMVVFISGFCGVKLIMVLVGMGCR